MLGNYFEVLLLLVEKDMIDKTAFSYRSFHHHWKRNSLLRRHIFQYYEGSRTETCIETDPCIGSDRIATPVSHHDIILNF